MTGQKYLHKMGGHLFKRGSETEPVCVFAENCFGDRYDAATVNAAINASVGLGGHVLPITYVRRCRAKFCAEKVKNSAAQQFSRLWPSKSTKK